MPGVLVRPGLGKVAESTEVRQKVMDEPWFSMREAYKIPQESALVPTFFGSGLEVQTHYGRSLGGFPPECTEIHRRGLKGSSSGERAERRGAAVTPPEAPSRNPQEAEPEQKTGAGLGKKKN